MSGEGAEDADAAERPPVGLKVQLLAAKMAEIDQMGLSEEGLLVRKIAMEIATETSDAKMVEQVEKGVEELDVNARYWSEGGEVISCGHKLAMEVLHLQGEASGAARLDAVQCIVARGLDCGAEWRDGRAVGCAGSAILASAVWLNGAGEGAVLDLARELLRRGLDVNAEAVERSTRASAGTFIFSGAIQHPRTSAAFKVSLLEMLRDAGLDLERPCQQGRETSTTGDTIATRVCGAACLTPSCQAALLACMFRAGWTPGTAKANQRIQALFDRPEGMDGADADYLRECVSAPPQGAAAATRVSAPVTGVVSSSATCTSDSAGDSSA